VKTQNPGYYAQINRNNQRRKSVGISKHKVLIIGNNHANKCATELRNSLNHKYEVSGFIKPGASTREIIKTTEEEIATLKCNDVVILWGERMIPVGIILKKL
jgi:hypothetical protein